MCQCCFFHCNNISYWCGMLKMGGTKFRYSEVSVLSLQLFIVLKLRKLKSLLFKNACRHCHMSPRWQNLPQLRATALGQWNHSLFHYSTFSPCILPTPVSSPCRQQLSRVKDFSYDFQISWVVTHSCQKCPPLCGQQFMTRQSKWGHCHFPHR